MCLLPREREEGARLDGTGFTAIGAVGLIGAQFADVDVCHAPMIAPAADIGPLPRRVGDL